MKVLVSGDRDWQDEGPIRERLAKLPPRTMIIHGAARGADSIADRVARELGFPVKPVPAEWEKYHRAAGAIRNRQMLDLKPDLVIAFHPDLSRSKGTKDCVREARRRGVPVELHS